MMNRVIPVILLAGSLAAGWTMVTDADWEGVGQSIGFDEDGDPTYTVDRSGHIYLCAFDLYAGGRGIESIAMWDHEKWEDISAGVGKNAVCALAVDENGILYAGGEFSLIGGESCRNVAKWNGTAWAPVESGIDGTVYTLTTGRDGTLFAGFATSGGQGCGIARFNGSVWDTIGQNIDGYVTALTVDGQGNLYAAGTFEHIGTLEVNGVMMWSDPEWKPLDAGVRDTSGKSRARALCWNGKALYIRGEFDTAGSVAARNFARWDGAEWHSVGEIEFVYATSLQVDGEGNVYVAGGVKSDNDSLTGIVASWNGTAWTVISRASDCPGFIMVDSSGNLYGYYSGFMQWKEGSWIYPNTGKGLDGSVEAISVDTVSGRVYVAGNFAIAGNTRVDDLAFWENGEWHAGGTAGFATSLFYDNGSRRLFTSTWGNDGYSVLGSNEAGWDTLGFLHPSSNKIYALTNDVTGDLYAGGNFESMGSAVANDIARWDGTQWHALGNGISGAVVRSLVFDKDGNLYAGGDFEIAGSEVVNNIARWDGTEWSPLGGGVQKDPVSYYPVNALATARDGSIYAGGVFSMAGSVPASNIARWDGAAWSGLGGGINGRVDALAFGDDGTLFAGGYFTRAGDSEVNSIAMWDGAEWHCLGSGLTRVSYNYNTDNNGGKETLPGHATALAFHNGKLYVGGYFTNAGGKTSINFAVCAVGETNVRLHRGNGGIAPGIRYDQSNRLFCVKLTAPSKVGISLYTLSGRRAYHASEFRNAGVHVFRIENTGLANGCYFALVKAGRESLRYRVLIGK